MGPGCRQVAPGIPGGVFVAGGRGNVVKAACGRAACDGRNGPLARLQGPPEVVANAGPRIVPARVSPRNGGTEIMKCKHAQKTMLATSGRRKLSAEVLAHVEDCARCRQWKTKLTAIDRGIFLIPTPSGTDAKNAFLAEFLHEPVIEPSSGWKLKLPGTRWQQVMAGAAAVVVTALAFSGALRRDRPGPAIASSS